MTSPTDHFPDEAVAVDIHSGKVWITLADGRMIASPVEAHEMLDRVTPDKIASASLGGSVDWFDLQEPVWDDHGEIKAYRCPGIDIQALLRKQSPLSGVEGRDNFLWFTFTDERTIAVPLSWYPRLLNATPGQLNTVEVSPNRVQWTELDESLSVTEILASNPALYRYPNT